MVGEIERGRGRDSVRRDREREIVVGEIERGRGRDSGRRDRERERER